ILWRLYNASSSRRPTLPIGLTFCGSAPGTPKASVQSCLRRKSPSPSSKVKKVVKLKKSTSTLTTRSARSIAIPGGWRSLTFITTTPRARRNIRVTSMASAMLSARCESARSPSRSIFSCTYANAQCAPSIACARRTSASVFAARTPSRARCSKELRRSCQKALAVVVQFDSWYASNKILKFVHRRKWQFTCGVKFTRKLDGVSLAAHHRELKHKVYTPVGVETAEGETTYFVRSLKGRFSGLP